MLAGPRVSRRVRHKLEQNAVGAVIRGVDSAVVRHEPTERTRAGRGGRGEGSTHQILLDDIKACHDHLRNTWQRQCWAAAVPSVYTSKSKTAAAQPKA